MCSTKVDLVLEHACLGHYLNFEKISKLDGSYTDTEIIRGLVSHSFVVNRFEMVIATFKNIESLFQKTIGISFHNLCCIAFALFIFMSPFALNYTCLAVVKSP